MRGCCCKYETRPYKFLKREQGKFQCLILPHTEFFDNLSSLQCGSIDKSNPANLCQCNAQRKTIRCTHFKFNLALIFFLRLSFVTKSSVSSLNANITGGSLIFRLRHNCLMTSSTVRVGSIRARTVMPSFVVTLFVGTSATDFDPCPLVAWRGERVADDWLVDI
jgi:hypothetical protein